MSRKDVEAAALLSAIIDALAKGMRHYNKAGKLLATPEEVLETLLADGEVTMDDRGSAERLGDGPIENRHIGKMNEVAGALDELFNGNAKGNNRNFGFVLLVFPFGEGNGRCNFISNGADRKDIVVLFKEMIAWFEGQPDAQGTA